MKLNRVVFTSLVVGLLVAAGSTVLANEQPKETSAVELNQLTLSGMLVATKTDDAKKATAFDIQTSDGKIYHVIMFDEKAAQTMTVDLGALVNQQVELVGELDKADPQTIRITTFRKLAVENAPN